MYLWFGNFLKFIFNLFCLGSGFIFYVVFGECLWWVYYVVLILVLIKVRFLVSWSL